MATEDMIDAMAEEIADLKARNRYLNDRVGKIGEIAAALTAALEQIASGKLSPHEPWLLERGPMMAAARAALDAVKGAG